MIEAQAVREAIETRLAKLELNRKTAAFIDPVAQMDSWHQTETLCFALDDLNGDPGLAEETADWIEDEFGIVVER